jgi:hypothetical protein
MIADLQPDAAIFNACDVTTGDCLTENSGLCFSPSRALMSSSPSNFLTFLSLIKAESNVYNS